MKLQTKITFFVILILVFSIASITLLSYIQMRNLLNNQLEDNLFDIAYSVSEDNLVKNALTGYNRFPYLDLNDHIEIVRLKTDVDFIVVMNMNGIRLTHPNRNNIGLKFKGGDEEKVLKCAEEYASMATGTLGVSVRVFVPIYQDGNQIGAVSVGTTVNEINKEIYAKIKQFYPFVIIGLLLGICGASILSYNIKDSILGLEPYEIAWMFKENKAILDNVKEGIIALDKNGEIIQFNREAARILGLNEKDITKNTTEIIQKSKAYEIIKYGIDEEDVEIKIRPGVTILCKYNHLRDDKNEIIGQVINFRDLTEVRQMAEELTGIKKMAWSLRAQSHEFMNKLHTISGLIQLGEYDEAIKYISKTAKVKDEVTSILTHKIKNVSIAALLLAKHYKAEESRIKFKIDSQSYLSYIPSLISEDDLGSVIGNLIENSFDAVNTDGTGFVYFKIAEDDNNLVIEVKDNGPGITDDIREKIYEPRFSTKSGQRGYGMFIVKKIIDEANGKITLTVNNGTFWKLEIPMKGEI